MPQKIRNEGVEITSLHNNNYVEIYTPSTIGDYLCDGTVYDFFVTIELPSVDQLPDLVAPEGMGLMSKEEIEQDFANRTATSPAKTLSIYYELPTGLLIPARKILCYSRLPSYTVELIQFLTTKGKIGIANGVKIKIRIEDFNSGLLGEGDKISVWLVAEDYLDVDVETLVNKFGVLA